MRPSGPVLLALLVIAAALAVGTAGGATAPSMSIALAGTAVEDGGHHTVGSDPVMQLNVSADASLETVVVRVNGNTVHTESPGTATYRVEVPLDLPTGESDVKVIAKDGDGGVTSTTFGVLKDNRRPVVQFSGPLETDGNGPPDNATVDAAYMTVAGEIDDHTAIDQIVVTRRNVYQFAGREEVDRKVYRIDDPGSSFSQRVFLGNQSNELTVQLTDAMGNQRVYETTVKFNDSVAPTIDLAEIPQQPPGPVVELDGDVTDNGQLDAVTLTVEGQFQELTLLSPRGPKPDQTRTAYDVDREVDLSSGKHDIELTARDLAGNEATFETTVIYQDTIVPRIFVDRDKTAFTENGTLAVRGAVEYGEVTAVSVETMAADSGETTDIVQVYSGDVRESVPLDETLATADGRTKVVVRATDSEGTGHTQSFFVDPASGRVFAGEHTPTPTPTPTPTTQSVPTTTTTTGAPNGSANATATATPAPTGTSAGNGSATTATPKPQVTELLTSLPGFGAAPAMIALLLAILLARRRP